MYISHTCVGLKALSASLENRLSLFASTCPAAPTALYASAPSFATLLSMAPLDSVGHSSAHATQRHSKWYLAWSLTRSPTLAFEKTPE